ncbi:MAG: DUF494 family protein [Burkholderiaceae bacterium]
MADIFFYLLENYAGITQCPDAATLARRLAYEGFEENEVRAAIAWVELLRQPLGIEVVHATHAHSHRIYHSAERLHLGDDNLNFLSSLAHGASISAEQRERIIERCMMLPVVPNSVEHFKALVLTILWADEQSIDDALLHAMLDESDSDLCH